MRGSLDEIASPEVIGASWEVLGPLGHGSMGRVFLCRDKLLPQRLAAVKLLGRASEDPEGLARFAGEVEALERLAHPGIVGARGAGVDLHTDRLYVAMEYVEGETLSRRVAQGPLPPQDAISVFDLLFDALFHAHTRGVAHRDIKPSNIVLGAGGPRLVDFGIAVAHDRPQDAGELAGTPQYMAPELLADGTASPPVADLYALGLVMYEALTGRRAFPRPSGVPLEEATQRIKAAKLATAELDPGTAFPDALRSLVRGLTAADPRDRLVDRTAVSRLFADSRAALRLARPTTSASPPDDPTLAPPLPGASRRQRRAPPRAPVPTARHTASETPVSWVREAPGDAVAPHARRPARLLLTALALLGAIGAGAVLGSSWSTNEVVPPQLIRAAPPAHPALTSTLPELPAVSDVSLELHEALTPQSTEPEPAPSAGRRRPRKAAEATPEGPAMGTLVVDSVPSGARVRIDGRAMGTTPLEARLRPGDHLVHLSAAQHTDTRRVIELTEEPTTLSFELTPIAAEATPAGMVLVVAPGWRGATLQIDGNEEGTLPVRLQLAAGTHEFVVRGEDGEYRSKRDIDSREGRLTRVVLGK